MIMPAVKLDCLLLKQSFCLIHKHSTEAFETQTLQITLNAKRKHQPDQLLSACHQTTEWHRRVPSSPHCQLLRHKIRVMIMLLWAFPKGKLTNTRPWGADGFQGGIFHAAQARGADGGAPAFPVLAQMELSGRAPLSQGTDTLQLTPLPASPLLAAQLLCTSSRDPTSPRSPLWGHRGSWAQLLQSSPGPPATLAPLSSSSSALTGSLYLHCNKWQGWHLASPGLYFSNPQSFCP